MSCPIKSGTREAGCDDPGGCSHPDSIGTRETCVLAAFKEDGSWLMSGAPLITHQGIRSKMLTLQRKWKNLKKGYDVLERDTSSMLPLPMLFNLASCEVWLAALPWKGFDTRAVSLAKIL